MGSAAPSIRDAIRSAEKIHADLQEGGRVKADVIEANLGICASYLSERCAGDSEAMIVLRALVGLDEPDKE